MNTNPARIPSSLACGHLEGWAADPYFPCDGMRPALFFPIVIRRRSPPLSACGSDARDQAPLRVRQFPAPYTVGSRSHEFQ